MADVRSWADPMVQAPDKQAAKCMFDGAHKCVKQVHRAANKHFFKDPESQIRTDALNNLQDRNSVGYDMPSIKEQARELLKQKHRYELKQLVRNLHTYPDIIRIYVETPPPCMRDCFYTHSLPSFQKHTTFIRWLDENEGDCVDACKQVHSHDA